MVGFKNSFAINDSLNLIINIKPHLWRESIMASGNFVVPTPKNEPILTYAPNSPERLKLKAELEKQSKQAIQIPLVIGDKIIRDRPSQELKSPHNLSLTLASVAQAQKEDVNLAIDTALSAQKEWASLPWEERAAIFLKAADLISGPYREKMNAATMLGQSKTCHQAEIEAACELADFLRFNAYFAQEIYSQQPMYSENGQWNKSDIRPLEGFVFAIAPFNFTAISLNLACAPALMGCTVILKPSPTAALSSHYGMEILREAGLPPGVINMINGDPETIGNSILTHPRLGGVHFTGSTKTFQHVWSEVGKNISTYQSYPRIVGETGGKDFVFAHASADINSLVYSLIRGAFEFQGQKCSAASRAYIPKSIWPEVKSKLVEVSSKIKMGDPKDFTNFMSAVIDVRAFEKIKSYIEHARATNDAEIICGGEYDQSHGYFIRPTIIEAFDPNYKSMTEEIFGPVLTIYAYEDKHLNETIELCEKTSEYALTGAIFAKDRYVIKKLEEAFRFCAGNFYINDKPTGAVVGQQPFGGSRGSGTNDKAGSQINLLRWVSQRTIKENFLPLSDYTYPFMGES